MLSRAKFTSIVGENIRAIRLKKNLSQEELAEACNFNRTYINLVETAK
jgi:transcriptional regulator with XRE-family HTH domain